MSMLFVSSEELKDRKALKARTWMLLEENKPLDSFGSAEYVKEQDISGKIRRESCRIVEIFDQPHNTINRLTSTTGTGRFAPFSVEQIVYLPEIELAIFVVAQTAISADNIRTAFERTGAVGFGKDASTGLGRFLVLGIKEINLFSLGSSTPNACYTLAPCVPPRSETWLNAFFSVVTRFGKHGDALAKSGKPFKNPVIMADDGAVFVSSDNQSIFEKPFFGSAITDVSKIEPATVTQGYAPYIPVKIGGE
jgi:CRISPR-associated protein Csm4